MVKRRKGYIGSNIQEGVDNNNGELYRLRTASARPTKKPRSINKDIKKGGLRESRRLYDRRDSKKSKRQGRLKDSPRGDYQRKDLRQGYYNINNRYRGVLEITIKRYGVDKEN